jgi:hypothetical protein|tara:strand:- start:2952 stop:3623 length:672 start_codon:yes stop_codon:yes gene_type:complete
MLPYFNKYGNSSGGPLNDICERFQIKTRRNSIPVIALQGKHDVKTAKELAFLIDSHHQDNEPCECGIVGKRTMVEISKALYDAQFTEEGKAILLLKKDTPYDLETCNAWIYNLFAVNSFKGKLVEDCALEKMRNTVSDKYEVDKSSEDMDCGSAVDLVIMLRASNKIIAGVQIKPESYFAMNRQYVKTAVREAQKRVDFPVHDLIYNSQGDFTNFISLIANFA